MTLFESLSYPAVPRVRPISGLLSYMSQCIPVLCLNQVDFFFFCHLQLHHSCLLQHAIPRRYVYDPVSGNELFKIMYSIDVKTKNVVRMHSF